MTKLIVGLGNVGPRYRGTRHNAGFMVVAELGERYHLTARTRGPAVVAEGRIRNIPVVLAQPTTMMNMSGRAVLDLRRRFNIWDLSDLLIILDEMDLPVGTIRLRARGSAGGHNGVKSIIQAVQSQEFARLRVGVGRPAPGEDPIAHVLSTFRPEEKPIFDEAIQVAADAVECWVEHGVERAMDRFNSWRAPAPRPRCAPAPAEGVELREEAARSGDD